MDLSVPEVHSGTDFTVYLHIKNPFAIPVWVRTVELSQPTQLAWRVADGGNKDGQQQAVLRNIKDRDKRIGKLRA